MRLALLAFLCACGSAAHPATAPAPAALPTGLTPDCFLGAGRCTLTLDLDGDTRADTITTVRDTACAPDPDADPDAAPEPDADADPDEPNPLRPCLQGFWLSLASGPTQLVGAGTTLDPDPSASPDDEPLSLDADLDYLYLLSITQHRPDGGRNATQLLASPCAGDALVLSSSDAAFLLCWRGTSARAYHLGY